MQERIQRARIAITPELARQSFIYRI